MKSIPSLVTLAALSLAACADADAPVPGATDTTPVLEETSLAASTPLRDKARGRLRNAVAYFHDQVARRGGYAWHQKADDLGERWGDIKLDADQIMIQSPGTSDVAIAFVEAALADPATPALRTYATDAALALRAGQVQSGGWRLYADFKATPTLRGCYRFQTANCGCGGCKFSSYDDQVTQNALVAMMRVDALLGVGVHASIAESSSYARTRVAASQYPTLGGFPQGFMGPVAARPALAASYPPASASTACGLAVCHDNAGYANEYWDDPTLNDNLATAFVEMLVWARDLYPAQSATYQAMLTAYGAFLRRAQMPSPQPAWAQQYDDQMRPRWARAWEAPAIAGQESQDTMWALLRLYQLDPTVAANRAAVGTALTYLESVDHASNTLLHRYIELDPTAPSNVGFMTRPTGYPVVFSPAPPAYQNYGWEVPSQLVALRAEYDRLATDTTPRKRTCAQLRADTVQAVDTTVNNQKWVTNYPTGPRSGAPAGDYLDTRTFVTNVRTLSEYLTRLTTDCPNN